MGRRAGWDLRAVTLATSVVVALVLCAPVVAGLVFPDVRTRTSALVLDLRAPDTDVAATGAEVLDRSGPAGPPRIIALVGSAPGTCGTATSPPYCALTERYPQTKVLAGDVDPQWLITAFDALEPEIDSKDDVYVGHVDERSFGVLPAVLVAVLLGLVAVLCLPTLIKGRDGGRPGGRSRTGRRAGGRPSGAPVGRERTEGVWTEGRTPAAQAGRFRGDHEQRPAREGACNRGRPSGGEADDGEADDGEAVSREPRGAASRDRGGRPGSPPERQGTGPAAPGPSAPGLSAPGPAAPAPHRPVLFGPGSSTLKQLPPGPARRDQRTAVARTPVGPGGGYVELDGVLVWSVLTPADRDSADPDDSLLVVDGEDASGAVRVTHRPAPAAGRSDRQGGTS